MVLLIGLRAADDAVAAICGATARREDAVPKAAGFGGGGEGIESGCKAVVCRVRCWRSAGVMGEETKTWPL